MSAEGKYLYFVSTKNGNRDIWRWNTITESAEPITTHSADDFDPAPSPDSSRLAFASLRFDAKGDLFVMDSPDGEIRRLTGRDGSERQPTWAPGSASLAYTCSDGNSPETICLMDMESSQSKRLVQRHGFDPDFDDTGEMLLFTSDTDSHGGANVSQTRPCLWLHRMSDGAESPLHKCKRPEGFGFFFPHKSENWIVFSRFEDDTDGDGLIDWRDRPSLWMQRILEWKGTSPSIGRAIPLTDGSSSDITPWVYGDRIYYASRKNDDLDIWALGLDGAMSTTDSLKQVQNQLHNSTSSLAALFVLRRCEALLSPGPLGKKCELLKADRLLDDGYFAQAEAAYGVLLDSSRDDEIINQATLGLVSAKMIQSLAIAMSPSEQVESRPVAEKLLSRLSDCHEMSGELGLVKGDILRRVGRWSESLDELESAIAHGDARHAAKALLLKGEVLRELGDGESSERTWVEIFRKYPLERSVSIDAGRRILRLAVSDAADKSGLVESLENVSARWTGLPFLSAMVRLEIGKTHLSHGDLGSATRAFEQLRSRFGKFDELAAEAVSQLAHMAEREGDLSKALDYASELVDRFSSNPEYARRGNEIIARLAAIHARELIRKGEAEMAIKVYGKLLTQDPDDLSTRRRIISLMVSSGHLDLALREYAARADAHPDDASAVYLYGLVLSYVDPPSRFDEAMDYMDKALEMDGQLAYAHQTRGWILEQRYHLLGDKAGLHSAADEYLAALGLLDAGANRTDEADLLLNLGNVFFFLGNYRSAYEFYSKRFESSEQFVLRTRRLIFLERYARSAMLSDKLSDAVVAFSLGSGLARQLGHPEQEARLRQGQAAALQLMGQYSMAVGILDSTCESLKGSGDLRHLARCYRNQGYNMYMDGDLAGAAKAFGEALEITTQTHENQSSKKVVSVGISKNSSRAALGFDSNGELNLLYAFAGRLYRRAGDLFRSDVSSSKRISVLQASMGKKGSVQDDVELSIALNNRGSILFHQGREPEACDAFLEAGQFSMQAGNIKGAIANLANRLDLSLSGSRKMSPTALLAETRGILDSADPKTLAPLDLARLLNISGVLHASMLKHDRRTGASSVSMEERISSTMAGLDSNILALHGAQEDFAAAALAARKDGSRLGLKFSLMAELNRAEVLRRAGMSTEAVRIQKRVYEQATTNALLGLQWRVPWEEPAKRVRLLLSLPPSVSGTGDDESARLARDDLFERLILSSLHAGHKKAAFDWIELYLHQKRLDSIEPKDLTPLTAQDRSYLRRVHAAEKSLQEAMASFAPNGDKHLRQNANEVHLALEAWSSAVHDGGGARDILKSVMQGTPESVASIRSMLDTKTGLLLTVSLKKELVVLLLCSKGLFAHRENVGRVELTKNLDSLWSDDSHVAEKARRLLSKWIIDGFDKELKSLQGLVAVTDDLRSHRHAFPLELLLYKGKALGRQIPVSHVYSSSDLVRFARLRNIRMQPAAWVGSPPGTQLMKSLGEQLGKLKVVDGPQGQVLKDISSSGLVIWSIPLLVDDERPLRSAFESDPILGAPSGVSLRRLLSVPSGSGLWLLRTEPGGVGGRFGGMVIDLASQGALVPSTGIIPGIPGKKNDQVLPWLLDSLQRKSPAQAFGDILGRLLDQGVQWQDLLGMELRGYWGMDLAARKRFATVSMGSFAAKAMSSFRAQNWSDALVLFLDVRRMALFLGKKSILPKVDSAIVTSAFRLQRYDIAAKYEKWILAAAQESNDAKSEAKAIHFLGILRSKGGHSAEAVDLLFRAIKSLDAHGLDKQAAQANADLAMAENAAFHYREAVQAAKNAMSRFKVLQNRAGEIRMMRLLGTIYLRRMNMIGDARSWYNKALDSAKGDKMLSLQGSILLDLARTELSTGSFELSKTKAKEALAIFKALSDKKGQAQTLLELAKAMWYRGEYQGALAAQEKALQWAKRAHDTRLKITAESLGGLILLNLGDIGRASSALRQALGDAMAAGMKDEQAVQLNNLGIVFRAQGKLDEALSRFEQALRLDSAMKNKRGRAYDLRNMGVVEQMLNQNAKARELLEQALALSKTVRDRFNQAKILVALARLEISCRQMGKAGQFARSAFDIARHLGAKEVQWRALRYMGHISQEEGSFGKAREHYAQAIALVEQMRAGLKTDAFRSGFLDNKYQLYEDMIHLLVSMNRAGEAFEYSERSRARVFLDILSESRLEPGSAEDRALVRRLKKLRRKMDELEHSSLVKQDPDGDQDERLEMARAEYKSVFSKLQASHSDLMDYLEVRSVGLGELTQMLDKTVALISYYVTERDTLAFVIRPEGLSVVNIGVTRSELERKVHQLRQLLQGFEDADTELRSLYALLVAPLMPALKDARIVGIIPHGPLHYLPFSALKSESERYLSDDVLLFTSPSASVLAGLLRRKKLLTGPYGKLLAVGDPRLDLPFSQMEAEAIGEEQGESNVLIGKAATEDKVKRLMPQSGIVHLATHGQFDDRNPMRSSVMLAPGEGEDGSLSAAEVFQMNLAARLVTLSACETGLGHLGGGDEMIGLQRSFLAAGAGSVLSSLWRVNDVATAMLMKQFYRNLRTHDELTSLKLAQDLVRRYFPQPGYWASFVLTGAW